MIYLIGFLDHLVFTTSEQNYSLYLYPLLTNYIKNVYNHHFWIRHLVNTNLLNSIILDIANFRLFKPVNSSLPIDFYIWNLLIKVLMPSTSITFYIISMSEKQYHRILDIKLTLRFLILIHVPLHPNCSIINNVYKTGASLTMSMIVILVLALRRNSSTNQLDI